jgi:hypothetical protein
MGDVCNKCGVAPAGVTHVCPPIGGTYTFVPQMIDENPLPTCAPVLDDKQRISDLESRVWQLESRIWELEHPHD